MNVSIYQDPCFGNISIYFWEQRNGKHYSMQCKETTMIEVEDGGSIPGPTLRLPFESLKSLAEALDKYDVKTDSDAKIAGTLEATREHLKDLQKLVFKEKK